MQQLFPGHHHPQHSFRSQPARERRLRRLGPRHALPEQAQARARCGGQTGLPFHGKNVLSGNDHARSHFVGPQQREVQGLQNGHPDHPPEKGGFRSAPLAGTSRAVVTACRTRSGRESAYSSRARYAGPYRTPLSWTDPINPPVFLRPHANPPAPGGGP